MYKSLLKSLIPLLLALLIQFWSCTKTKVSEQNINDIVQTADSIRHFYSVVNATKISDPEYARSVAEKAMKMVTVNDDQGLNANIYLIAGIALQLNDPDSAYNYYQLAFQSAVNMQIDSIKPRILYNIAMLYKIANNYQESIKMLDSSQRMACNLNDHITMSNCYNSIGNIEHRFSPH